MALGERENALTTIQMQDFSIIFEIGSILGQQHHKNFPSTFNSSEKEN